MFVNTGVMVFIINPAQVTDFGRGLAVRTKTDDVDSVVLVRYGVLFKPNHLLRKHEYYKPY